VRGFGGGGARRHSNRAKDFDNVTQKAVEGELLPPGTVTLEMAALSTRTSV
jgi:hypothetical protein